MRFLEFLGTILQDPAASWILDSYQEFQESLHWDSTN